MRKDGCLLIAKLGVGVAGAIGSGMYSYEEPGIRCQDAAIVYFKKQSSSALSPGKMNEDAVSDFLKVILLLMFLSVKL